MTDGSHPAVLERLRRMCRERGLPLTVQRRTVLEVMLDLDDHPTAERIYTAVSRRLPGISRTSVYRILDLLAAAGLVTRVHHPGSTARYDIRTQRHHHLYCVGCEKMIDLDEERLNRIPWPDAGKHGFEIQGYQIHFHGLCAACRRTGGRRRPTSAGRRKTTVPGRRGPKKKPSST